MEFMVAGSGSRRFFRLGVLLSCKERETGSKGKKEGSEPLDYIALEPQT
jgi:hypothetical protein